MTAPATTGAGAATTTGWYAMVATRAGASHKRSQPPVEDQDAVGRLPTGGYGPGAAVLLADGHGSRRSFRSALGSRLAVAASETLCEDLLRFGTDSAARSRVQAELEGRVGRQLVRVWRELVTQALEQGLTVIRQEEYAELTELEGAAAAAQVSRDPHLAFGSTVLTAVATASYMAYWQIGDGDILVVDATGEASRPLRADPALLGNATTSLCSPQAWNSFRWGLSGSPAALIVACTDGVSNSYSTDEGFLQVGTDLLKRLVRDGIEPVENWLGDMLTALSERGSGDDASIGLICNLPVIDQLRERGVNP